MISSTRSAPSRPRSRSAGRRRRVRRCSRSSSLVSFALGQQALEQVLSFARSSERGHGVVGQWEDLDHATIIHPYEGVAFLDLMPAPDRSRHHGLAAAAHDSLGGFARHVTKDIQVIFATYYKSLLGNSHSQSRYPSPRNSSSSFSSAADGAAAACSRVPQVSISRTGGGPGSRR